MNGIEIIFHVLFSTRVSCLSYNVVRTISIEGGIHISFHTCVCMYIINVCSVYMASI